MAAFTVKIIVDVPELSLHRERERTLEVPPDYVLEDKVHLFALVIEGLAEDLVEAEGWVPPMRQAAFANDAKITRIEQLVKRMPADIRAQIMQVIHTDPEDAIRRWALPSIEG